MGNRDAVRWQQRHDNFRKALAQLEAACGQEGYSDLALFGPAVTLDDQAGIAGELDVLPIPQRVDLLRYKTVKDKKLRDHILTHGVEWFRRAGRTGA